MHSNQRALGARRSKCVSTMTKKKFGVAVDEDITSEVDELVDECDDLGASRSEIIEAILTAYVRSEIEHAEQVRELIIRRRRGSL